MHSRRPAFRFARAAIAGWLVAQLLWVLTLAAAPAWHEWVHPEAAHCAGHEDGERHEGSGKHECAVTLFLSGACDWARMPDASATPAFFVCPELLDGGPPLVIFEFRSRGIFEHAPPRRA